MSYDTVEANVKRYLFKKLQDLGTSLGVSVKDQDMRNPFIGEDEDETLVFRFLGARRPVERENVWAGFFSWEIHCVTKRGDLRRDKRLDRHLVLAGYVEKTFRDDVDVYDAVGGDTNLYLGCVQGLQTQLHTRDKRNTIFGADVDYSVETPTTLQAVVTVTGLFQTSK